MKFKLLSVAPEKELVVMNMKAKFTTTEPSWGFSEFIKMGSKYYPWRELASTSRARLIQSQSSATFFFELSGNSNYDVKLLMYLMFDEIINRPEEKLPFEYEFQINHVRINSVRPVQKCFRILQIS